MSQRQRFLLVCKPVLLASNKLIVSTYNRLRSNPGRARELISGNDDD